MIGDPSGGGAGGFVAPTPIGGVGIAVSYNQDVNRQIFSIALGGSARQVLASGGTGNDPILITPIPENIPILAPPALMVWAVPLLLTELSALTVNRVKADLSGAVQARLVARVAIAGLGGSELRAQYSTDESTWNYLDGAAGPACSLTAIGTIASGWVTMAAGAVADVFLRIVGINGNGIAAASIGNIILQVR
jgi:hypothetical protein